MNSKRTSTASAVIVATLGLSCAMALPAFAQSTTSTSTSTSSTTSTTRQPHPFSKATRECIQAARADLNACTDDEATCQKAFQTAFANCFANTKCAAKCLSTKVSCLSKTPAGKKACHKTCRTNRTADKRACRLIARPGSVWAGGDGSCLTGAAATFDLCMFVCDEAAHDCQVSFRFCIADCPNLQ